MTLYGVVEILQLVVSAERMAKQEFDMHLKLRIVKISERFDKRCFYIVILFAVHSLNTIND